MGSSYHRPEGRLGPKRMPINDYRCTDCQAVSTLLTYSYSGPPSCSKCGGGKLDRLVSRFAFHQSWGSSLNWAPSGETLRDVDEDDPKSIHKFMGEIKKEMGGQVTPDFEDMRREVSDGS